MRPRLATAALLAAALLALALLAAGAATPQTSLSEIESEVMCPVCGTLLELADSVITYRLRYLSAPQLIPTLDLVLLDAANPHSVRFQIRELQREIAAVAADYGDGATAALVHIEVLLSRCVLDSLDDGAHGKAGKPALAEMSTQLTALAEAARGISNQLALKHFAHVADVSQATLSA